MIKRFAWIVLVAAALALAQAAVPAASTAVPDLKPMPPEMQTAHLVANLLTRYHYKPTALDDTMSRAIFDRYLKALDPERMYFTQADIDGMSAFRTGFDDAIVDENLTSVFAVFNLYAQRVHERYDFARALLERGFDFSRKENYVFDREKAPWAKSEAEARDLWRRRVKNDWLRLKLAGKDDKAIVDILDKRYEQSLKRIDRLKSDDVFQIFMNAYTTAIEPHTNYMGPRVAEDFDISMSLSLVGIGAALTERDDYVTIRELIPGGPAMLSGKLKVGDRIVGVAQGEKGAMVDIVGWRLDDAVAIIRGSADSVVVLDIIPADAGLDGKHKLVPLVRKKITLEEQSAKKSILTVPEGKVTRRIGVITLPTFYEDFDARRAGNPNYKSATHDVARLLGELKADKVDAVLLDLRNNGGGSLTEAVELTGLFIGKGPVVQERDARGAVTVLSNTTTNAAWDGPLGVLINRGSASASEIFAAAIQDYGRGLIIGEPSFGKGTVQTMIDLDELAKNAKPKFGDLKFTIAQFFRVNGGTTQLRGVTPDIVFPSSVDPEDMGESSYDNALPWMQVKPADYRPEGDVKSLISVLTTRSEARTRKDGSFQCFEQAVTEARQLRAKNEITLNEAARRRQRSRQDARLAACENEAGAKSGAGPTPAKVHRDDGLQANERSLAADIADEKLRKSAKDVLLDAAVHILGDEVGLVRPVSFATRGKTSAAAAD
jgi:carboxyl-terminal processing protease